MGVTLATLFRRGAAAASSVLAVGGLLGGGYLTVIGWAARRPLPAAPADPTPSGRRFRILVPAHDEERRLPDTIDALRAIEYPAQLVEIHVVADNCGDRTAQIARAAGLEVHERQAPAEQGKGAALAWLIDRLPPGAPDDVFVVVDADTTVSPELLCAFDRAFAVGADAAQGLYLVHDADRGGEVGFRAAALAIRHLVRPAGRTALGGSSSLYGNGMAFREPIARRFRWSNDLTEDLEMGLRLLLAGHTVAFVEDAVVEADMPETRADALSQNQRWEAGRLRVARRYAPRLIAAAIRRRHGRRWPYADAAIDISLPPLTTFAALTGAAALGAASFGRGRVRWFGAAAVIALGLQVAHVVAALRRAGAPPAVRRSLLRAPAHLVWKSKVWASATRAAPSDWVRTTRDRSGGIAA